MWENNIVKKQHKQNERPVLRLEWRSDVRIAQKIKEKKKKKKIKEKAADLAEGINDNIRAMG